MFRSHFPFRLIRQSWTKSYSTISVKEVEEMRKKDVFFSLHLKREDETVNMAAAHAGTPLSASRLITIEGSSIQFEKLVPSLFEFLEKVTTNDRRDDEPKWEAFEVLENALQVLTCPSEENSSELTYEVLDTLRDLLLSESKSNTEAAVNLEIVNLILKRLTRAYIMLNKSHSKVFKPSKRLLMPESLLWDGLALGHRDAWYGELDMLIFTSITGEAGSKVALLGEKCGVDPPFDEDEEERDVEDKTKLMVIGSRKMSSKLLDFKHLFTRREDYPFARVTLASGLKLALVYKQISQPGLPYHLDQLYKLC